MSRRGLTAAAAVGLVLAMTGCAGAAPQGDDLYERAAATYFPMAEDLHTVLMAIHEGQWTIPTPGSHGATPSDCRLGPGDEYGYYLNAVREVTLDAPDPVVVSDAAADAFTALGLEPQTVVRGEGRGDGEEHLVIADSDRLGHAIVTIRPARGTVRVQTQMNCAPGNAHALLALLFDEDPPLPSGLALRPPAFEGPDSVPQFYFPADGPVYWEEVGVPADPQPPVVTDPPEAPYGE